jgi:hypothetical protein
MLLGKEIPTNAPTGCDELGSMDSALDVDNASRLSAVLSRSLSQPSVHDSMRRQGSVVGMPASHLHVEGKDAEGKLDFDASDDSDDVVSGDDAADDEDDDVGRELHTAGDAMPTGLGALVAYQDSTESVATIGTIADGDTAATASTVAVASAAEGLPKLPVDEELVRRARRYSVGTLA